MKHFILTLATLAATGSLSACSKEATTVETAVPPTAASATPAAPAPDMAAMPMAADAKMAKGRGTVTAVSADSVTIDHAPIPEANWGAMTMTFKATPDVAAQVKAGDKVAFDLKVQGSSGEVMAIKKQ